MIWSYYFIIIIILLLFATSLSIASSNQLGEAAARDGNGNIGAISKKSCFYKEKQALLHFKASISSQDPFGLFSTWKPEDDDCCNWSRIICNHQTGHVTELYLSYGLAGEISPSLLNLTYLIHLDLSWNSFNGSIPNFIGSMTQLRYLDLSYNYFNGTIPKSIGSLTQLRYLGLSDNSLDLSYNMLDGVPKYLGNLCSLTHLYLYNNQIAVKFSDFLNILSGCTMITLETLDASYNQFRGPVSDEIQNFSSLEFLDLSDNHLSGTMSEKVWELPNLERLDVSSNSLVITPNIGKSKISYINISHNSLVVTPSKPHMSNIYHVEFIDMSACNLGPLYPKWIQTYKNLTHLDISGNRISDTIPVLFWKTWPSRLRYLNLSSNNMSGKVLDLSSNFDIYPTIDLSSNNFYGSIPKVPSTLLSLNLSKNKFYGGISFLCQIVDEFLTFLDLSHNLLTGQLPDCLWHFKELKVLNLGHNNLYGKLPASIGYSFQLEVLDLYNNSLSGELPLDLKNCTSLTFLNLGANKFSGNVPIWIGENLTMLYGLILRSNNFFGSIPVQLCQLVNLQIFDLSMNNLNGTIPSCVNNLTAMVHGRYFPDNFMHAYTKEFNKYNISIKSGTYVDNAIMEWQGNERELTSTLRFLMSIDLSSNNLTGQIPKELTNLHELFALNLSKNALLGEIPRKIGEMKNLATLDLSRNHFSGGIPSSMSQMTSLNYLDVSYNKLSGRIPSSTQLQSFERSRYIGNAGLCGPPVTKSCPGDEVPPVVPESESGEEGKDELERWFYVGGSIGFATGFWMACGVLLLNRRGRHAFFPFVDFVKDWVYVKAVVIIRRLERVAGT